MTKHKWLNWWQRSQGVLWDTDIHKLSSWKAFFLTSGRILYRVVSDVRQGQLTLRAMSLVYTSLLSLVPLLALSFSVFKAFGIHNQLEPLLMKFLAPLGERGSQVAVQVVQFVENMNVGVLGSLGLLLLIYTVVSLIQKIESAFNFIWHVSSLRNLMQRFSGYLSVVMIGPMLVVTALGITASVASAALVQELIAIEPFGSLFYALSKLVPYLLVIGAFTATYLIIPNTSVRLRSALIGGVVAGMLWESVGWGFTSFIVGSAKYEAVYSGFAIMMLLLVWLYLNWLVLLLGASIAFYHQYPAHQTLTREHKPLASSARKALALELLRLIGQAYQTGERCWSLETLASHLDLPIETIMSVTGDMVDAGLLVNTLDDPPCLLPGRDLQTIQIQEVLEIEEGAIGQDASSANYADPQILAILQELREISGQHLQGHSVKTLISTPDKSNQE